jgi:PAS domain S-box-containing protein
MAKRSSRAAVPVTASEIELKAVLEIVVHGVIVIDERGAILEYSASCETIFGWAAAETLGRNVSMLMPSPYRDEHDGYLSRYLRTGERRIIGIGREVLGQRKDGATFPMYLSVGEARVGDRPIFVGVVRDVTELKRGEQALRDSEARLRAVLDTAVDAILVIDEQGVVQTYSQACERLFGWRADEVEGRNVSMLMPSPYRDEHDGYIGRYLRTGERRIIGIGREVQGQRKDGTVFPCELSVGEMRQRGQRAFVGIVRDLSERKRIEQDLVHAQKMEAVGQLTGGIAHDFNNLLTVIMGNLEMLEARLDDPDQEALAKEAREAAELGAQLTGRLLGFARRQALRPQALDANELVLDMSDMLRRTLGQSVQISTVLANRLWKVLADPGQLQNAILNLAINARDAMPHGGKLIVETANTAFDEADVAGRDLAPGAYVSISITDDGVGMPPEVRQRALEPFFTTKPAGVGSGLGLSMVYGFAKQTGGDLRIYSEAGQGTTVTIYLPQTAGEGDALDEGGPREAAFGGRGERLLVVEDDARVRLVTVRRLREMGYRVEERDSGEAALALLRGGDGFDLLLTDVLMPGGMSGPDLARRARALVPGLRVLLSSGYADPEAMRDAMAELDADLLRKPYKRGDLAAAVRRALDSKRPSKPRRRTGSRRRAPS